MDQAAQHLRALARAAITGEQPPEEAVDWIARAAHRLLHGHAATLDEAAGLAAPSPGSRRVASTARRELRNHHLAAALALIDGEHLEPRLAALLEEIERSRLVWEHVQRTGKAPTLLNDLHAHIYLARQAGRLPSSTSGLRRAIFGASGRAYAKDS